MVEQIPMIIDTDPGVDDAIAISIALGCDAVKILALTITFGNCTAKHAHTNAFRILATANRLDIPVYFGAEAPLRGPNSVMCSAYHVHGDDGLGGVMNDSVDIIEQEDSAAQALVRISKEYDGRVRLVALGPLTNIARAIEMDCEFTSRLERLVVMGGAVTGDGNMGMSNLPTAEHNFACDPHAAAAVLSADGYKISPLVADWELSKRLTVSFGAFESMTKALPGMGAFLWEISHHLRGFLQSLEFEAEAGEPTSAMVLPDPLAIALAIDSSLAADTRYARCTVDVSDENRLGTSDCHFFDAQPAKHESGMIEAVFDIQMDKFAALLKHCVAKC